MSKLTKKVSALSLIDSTPHFQNEDLSPRKSMAGKNSSVNIRISEFQTDELETSRMDSLANISNVDIILKSVEDDYTKAKPVNPLAYKEDQDKSVDLSVNSGVNSSQISENKLHSYAQKTKKLNMENLKSFKSLNFANKNKNIETKYDDEYNQIDDKSKAAYNVCETFSSNVHNTRNSSNNLTGSNRITNPFNISSKINKFQQPTNPESLNKQPLTVRFKLENNSNTNLKENIEKGSQPSRHEKKLSLDVGSNVGTETVNNSFMKSKTVILDTSDIESSEIRITEPEANHSNIVIDNKLKALVNDSKLKAEKVLKTGSLLSILNLSIRTTPIFSCTNVNIAEVYNNFNKDVFNSKKKKRGE
jgi:hypothetical protein